MSGRDRGMKERERAKEKSQNKEEEAASGRGLAKSLTIRRLGENS